MRLFVSALLLAAASAGFAQNGFTQNQAAPAPGSELAPGVMTLDLPAVGTMPQSQAGCPVVLTSARLNWPASYLPVASAEKVTEPNLALHFQNSSGKALRSVTITARFLTKQSMYQLDASGFDLHLTFSGVDAADKAAEQLREIRLPEKMYAYGVTRVALEQVTFGDGTFWMAMGRNNCSLNVRGTAERVAK
ncbi:MAG: hypothetical protein ABSA94_06935 [Acidobacteriaceae bacterium]|jgi:hypothetical protein